MLIKKEEEDGRILGDESWVEEPWKKFRDESVVYIRLWALAYSSKNSLFSAFIWLLQNLR